MKSPLFIFSLLFISLVLQPCSADTAEQPSQQLMAQWLNLESQKGALTDNWESRRLQIQQRLDLYEKEHEVLAGVVEQSKTQRGDVDARRLELLQKQSKLEAEQTTVDSQIQIATKSLTTMVNRLPQPLQSAWNEKIPLLAQENVSNSEKLERILSLLKDADEFDRKITSHRAIIEVQSSEGKTLKLMVNQIYAGLGHGWYVSDDGKYYGYGRSEQIGWKWWHGDAAKAELNLTVEPKDLLKVIAVFQNPTSAAFLPLPIKLN